MQTLIFGDIFFAARTQRACGGKWIDIEKHKFEVKSTLFIQAGSLIRPIPEWNIKKAVMAVGATNEDQEWINYFAKSQRGKIPRSRSFYLSAAAIKKLKPLLARYSFWEAIEKLAVKKYVEPQLRSWYHGRLRILQVVTSLHVGGAEKICVDLAKMPESVGIVSLGSPRRTELRPATWDLTKVPYAQRIQNIIQIAKKSHVDVVHTHLLTAEQNQEIEKHFPLVTTMHNTPEGWPKGYDTLKPGLLVACSKMVAKHIGPKTPVAWNGVKMELTRKPRVKSKKEIRLVAVANFRPQKRLERLPAILKELINLGYSPRLTVVGEIHHTDPASKKSRDKFWLFVRKYKLAKRIEEVSTLDVRSVLAKNHIFISVSAHEGLSLSQLEALAAGLPVVATDVGGASEIKAEVGSDAYYTLNIEATAKQFAAAIEKVRSLPRSNRLPAAFTSDYMRRRYLWIYYSALARKASQKDEIWLLTNNFSMGGAQTSARRLLQKLSKHFTVKAFTLQENTPTLGSKDLLENGISVENISGLNDREISFNFLKKIASGKPRALFFWNTMSPIKCLIADGANCKIIDVSPGEMYFNEMNRYLAKAIPELPIRKSNEYGALLSSSVVKYEREVEKMKNFLERNVVVVPNGVEGIPITRRSFKKEIVFGTSARIAPHKRLEDLIEAFADIPAQLYIAGRVEPGADDYAADLKKRSTSNIHWLGQQNIKEFLPTLDIFVMISEPAGCPNASLEAMANGLPIIITDVGGANEQAINGLNGWLVPPRDTPALKKAINQALKAPASTLQVMSKASLYHVQHFSMDKMLERYTALLS